MEAFPLHGFQTRPLDAVVADAAERAVQLVVVVVAEREVVEHIELRRLERLPARLAHEAGPVVASGETAIGRGDGFADYLLAAATTGAFRRGRALVAAVRRRAGGGRMSVRRVEGRWRGRLGEWRGDSGAGIAGMPDAAFVPERDGGRRLTVSSAPAGTTGVPVVRGWRGRSPFPSQRLGKL